MEEKKILGVNKNVFVLGIVSFLTDVSSEMIFSVFSLFVTLILGLTTVFLGIIEGLSDFATSSLDYLSGYITDKTGKRRRFAALGYGFSTLAKGFLLFANSALTLAAFRIIERLGKSFRGPPRDAWIVSLVPEKERGFSFGAHKALDKGGAVIGPLIAFYILKYLGQSPSTFKLLFIIAFFLAFLAVFLIFLVKDKEARPKEEINLFTAYKGLSEDYKHYLKSSAIFSLAYFSFSFLLLKAYLVGFTIKDVVLLYALFNLSCVIVSTPIGKLGDYLGRKKIIITEFLIYSLMSFGFIFAHEKWQVIILFVLFGIFFAIDEGQTKAYITDLQKERRATALGLYNFIIGLVYLPASIITGLLWKINPNYAFTFGALISALALFYFLRRK
jgi:MFS family permease